MRYLGIDLGSKTVGLAISDPTLTIASSFKTIFLKMRIMKVLLMILN